MSILYFILKALSIVGSLFYNSRTELSTTACKLRFITQYNKTYVLLDNFRFLILQKIYIIVTYWLLMNVPGTTVLVWITLHPPPLTGCRHLNIIFTLKTLVYITRTMCTVCPHSPGHWTDGDRLNPGLVPDVQLLPVSPVQIGHSDGAPPRLLVVRGEVHVFGDPVHREGMQTQCSPCKQ